MTRRFPLRRGLHAVRVLFAASLVAVVTGCFSAEMSITVRPDDTADVAYKVMIDVERLGELASALGSDLPDLSGFTGEELLDELSNGDNPCSELAAALAGRNVESTTVSEGSRRGVRCSVEAVPVGELDNLGDDTSIDIERNGDETVVTLNATGLDELTADSSGIGAELGASFSELLEISFVVSAPGTLVEHNATSVAGATATWIVSPEAPFVSGGRAQMRAVWTTAGSGPGSSGGSSTTVVVIVALGVVMAAVAVGLVLRRRRSPQPGGAA